MGKTLFVRAKAAQQASGELAQAELTLGDWSPFHARSRRPTLFAPEEIEYVAGVAHGVILAVYKITGESGEPWQPIPDADNPERWRVRFSGVRVLRHLEGTPSPVVWSRGQGTPVKVADSSLLTAGDVPTEPIDTPRGPARRAVLDRVVVTRGPEGDVVVDAPPGTTVTVRTASTEPKTALPAQSSDPGTGRYYTRDSLIEQVVAAVLDTMDDEMLQKGGLSMCEPAGGTGAFLGEAITQIAQRYGADAPEIVVTAPLVIKLTERVRARLEEGAA
ncbi:hypothetical protein ACWFR5_35405 [Streptomyces sp. NPDC055092]